MENVATEAKVEKKFEIEVIYNGQEKEINVEESETVKQLLDRSIQAFAVTQQPHLLALYTASGQELTNESQSVRDAGVRPRTKILLRPSKVKGG